MMVLFNFRRSPSRRGKTAAERRAKSSAYPLQMPLSLASEYCHPAGGWPFLPFPASTGSLLCWRAAATAVWREYRPTAGALAAVGFPRRMGAVQRRDRCAGLDFNIMTQRGRASATVQVVSDLQCPASEGLLMFYKARIWPGAARPAAASAGAVDPRGICVPWAAMDACCWRRSRSNNRQEMIYCSYRDVLLRGADRLKNIVTQGRQWDIIPAKFELF